MCEYTVRNTLKLLFCLSNTHNDDLSHFLYFAKHWSAVSWKLRTHCLSWTRVEGWGGGNNGSWWKFATVIKEQMERTPYRSKQACQMPNLPVHCTFNPSSSLSSPRQARGLQLGRVHRALIPSLLSPAEQHIHTHKHFLNATARRP